MKKEKLINIIKEELSNLLKEDSNNEILSTLLRVKEGVTKELERRGMSVRWIKEGKETTFAGERNYEYYGKFKDPEYEFGEGVINATGGVKVRTGKVFYQGDIFYSSGYSKRMEDGEEFIKYMVKQARDFKFPRQLGGDFPEYR